ncbi:sulfatase-like hydrolase/transferase [Halobacteria archaeon AArc-curdl1]|uniref:Sulfatase-like hydrolase/transferase n=1 Tax=Natronosalvus hydrolyticus TaxID=2979988 RepID=A0AAP3E6F6_9EURY|nr:sulfatase-like hydrolase/transferase [Halobacteria archaeon AArc-curdl1]
MAATRPNVLFVLTDQERYDCTASDGPAVDTPAFDRLAASGVHFTQAFTPISICTSARASLLTGQFPHAHGMLNNCHEDDAIQANLDPDVPTFSEDLRAGGYDLTYTGKWHVGRDGTPERFGFRYLGGSDVHHDDLDTAFREYRNARETPLGQTSLEEEVYTHDDPENGTLVAAKTPVDVEDTRAYFLAERTIEALEAHANGTARGSESEAETASDDRDADRPFFHRADFYGPHHPYVVPEPYASMYDPGDIDPWDSYAETFDGKPAAHEEFLSYRGVDDFDWDTWASAVAKYFGFVTLLDHQFGRILDTLDDLGLEKDTVVVHASDHGDFTGSHRQFNKGPLMYDETYHIPLQVRWPGVTEPDTTCDLPVHLHDLAPTFLELGDQPIPDTMQARSLIPLLEGKRPDDWQESVFAQYHGEEFGLYTQRMVRTPAYKFVYNGPDRNELYDLEADPDELQNLVDHPAYEDVRTSMAERLLEWMHRTEDPNRKWVPDTII